MSKRSVPFGENLLQTQAISGTLHKRYQIPVYPRVDIADPPVGNEFIGFGINLGIHVQMTDRHAHRRLFMML